MRSSTASRVTTDHEEIRRWAEARSGKPATAVRSESSGDVADKLCICFPENGDRGALDEISWKNWFKEFEACRLALLYQEHNAGGEKSNFHKLVTRKTVDQVESAVGGKGRSASRRRLRRDVPAIPPVSEAERNRDSTRRVGSRMAGKVTAETARTLAITKKQPSPPAAGRDNSPQPSTSRSKAKPASGRLGRRLAGK